MSTTTLALVADGPQRHVLEGVGAIEYGGGRLGLDAAAVVGEDRWRFARAGGLRPRLAVRDADGEECGGFRRKGWRGGGGGELHVGEQHLRLEGARTVGRRVYRLVDPASGSELAELHLGFRGRQPLLLNVHDRGLLEQPLLLLLAAYVTRGRPAPGG